MHQVRRNRYQNQRHHRGSFRCSGACGRVLLPEKISASILHEADKSQEHNLGFRHTQDHADLHANDGITKQRMARVGIQ